MDFKNLSETKRALMVGMAKRMFDEGMTSSEVASKLCISESRVRAIKKTIDDAEDNKNK